MLMIWNDLVKFVSHSTDLDKARELAKEIVYTDKENVELVFLCELILDECYTINDFFRHLSSFETYNISLDLIEYERHITFNQMIEC